jgi:hypothetical protein
VEIIEGIPPFVKKRRRRGRKGVGLRYEAAVQRHLLDRFGYEYVPSPWFRYSVAHRPRVVNYAQPDGLLVQPKRGTVTIVEIKYNHCPESYFQLVDKYLPLVSTLFSDKIWDFPLVEVVKWYDRDTQYPTNIRLRADIDECRPGEIGVHICRPDRLK